jgi:hypothetical protein
MAAAVQAWQRPSAESYVWLRRAGDTGFAGAQHASWMRAWRHFGWLPELFDIAISTRHPLEKVRG